MNQVERTKRENDRGQGKRQLNEALATAAEDNTGVGTSQAWRDGGKEGKNIAGAQHRQPM